MNWIIHPAIFGAAGDSVSLTPLGRCASFAAPVFGVETGVGADIQSSMNAGQMQAAIEAKIATYVGVYGAAYATTPRLAYWGFEGAYGEAWGEALYLQAQAACESASTVFTWGAYKCPLTDLFQTSNSAVSDAVAAENDALASLIATTQVHIPDFYTVNTTGNNAYLAARANMVECRRNSAAVSVKRIVPIVTAYRQPGVPLTSDLFVPAMRGLAEAGIQEFIMWGSVANAQEASDYSAVVRELAGPFAAAFGSSGRRVTRRGLRG